MTTQPKSSAMIFDLSIVVIFHNMRREAPRTLFSMSREYQRDTNDISYEVIAIDNGSTESLDENLVKGFGENFRYEYMGTDSVSPCKALNHGADIARGRLVMICIDGARILSPGILNYSMLASKLYKNPFIYTLGMHIGTKPQNYLVEENYSQADEDRLLESIDWKHDGYALFDISSVAFSSKKGYLSDLTESNCFTLPRSAYQQIGGYDEKFAGPGGGLTNLDLFNRINQNEDITPVMLLGEATFHQFHGGTATNVPMKDHPWRKMADEYQSIRGKPFSSFYKPPVYLGKLHPKSNRLMIQAE